MHTFSSSKFLLLLASVQFSSVVADSLQPHEPQYTRPPCPSPTPGVHPNPCPLCRQCHSTISSSVIPFSCPQSFPTSGSFQMSQLSASGGQSIGVSASTSVPPKNTQDWSPLGWTGWISLQIQDLVIQVYAPTSNAEKAEVEMVLWRLIRPSRTNTPKRCHFHYKGLECKSRKSRDTWSNRQIWPWSTEWSRAKAHRVLPGELTGHSKHPLPTTQEKTPHMDITRWSTLKSDWLYPLHPKMEKFYTSSLGAAKNIF